MSYRITFDLPTATREEAEHVAREVAVQFDANVTMEGAILEQAVQGRTPVTTYRQLASFIPQVTRSIPSPRAATETFPRESPQTQAELDA